MGTSLQNPANSIRFLHQESCWIKEYRRLGRSGLQVSEMCLGIMTFRWTSTEEQSYQVLDRAWDAGINFIDTADGYSAWAPGNRGGIAEQIIGKWLLTQPFVTAPIIGANTIEQLDELLGAAGLPLTEEERLRLDDLTGVDRNWFGK